ncbi:sugar phosphate isomerase/epimerase [Acidisoma cellulosilytica]|uniref:Sugar phosphate isomerase/epimerase n=1 Tax=Acidisoma cellulosilyticum TaxID=2802395 RepID=A0A963Z6R9_9PROT|nr:sugar phosphate isomerase/epimerase [Acidisoma cellulosilyticum]MCB8883569.1 sugar phosphate isomerase/epimerase [Acidisoma cellulosilyticum]
MISDQRILAAYWTLAGDCFPGGKTEVSPYAFETRVAAAAAAGYGGIGLVHADIQHLRDALGFSRMRAILDAHGMRDLEVEIFSDWFANGERRARSDVMRADLLIAAQELGASHIKISGDMDGADWPLPVMADAFGTLCAEAARAGTRVGIEIMPWSNLSTIANTMPVVNAANAKNGGVLLDVWHMVRGHVPFEDIGRLPADKIISIELDDGPAQPAADLWHETLHDRLLCGEGAFDIPGFLSQVARTGYDGPVGVEILSKDHRILPLDQMAQRAFDSVKKVLA